jgi:glutamate racemase
VLRRAIAAATGTGVTLIDSGAATATDVGQVLDAHDLRNQSAQKPNLRFFVSDIPAKFTEVGERFLGQRMGLVRRAPVGGT